MRLKNLSSLAGCFRIVVNSWALSPTRHCEEERRGNPRYTERLCKVGDCHAALAMTRGEHDPLLRPTHFRVVLAEEFSY
jgi:hypothetical protein